MAYHSLHTKDLPSPLPRSNFIRLHFGRFTFHLALTDQTLARVLDAITLRPAFKVIGGATKALVLLIKQFDRTFVRTHIWRSRKSRHPKR
jgi:hypothetical protein